MPFRFVHTADIHLDSPLRSLSLRNRDLASLVGDATRQALVAIVDLCIEEQVDALVIAGDLYDGEQTSMKTARFLGTEMARLAEAGIAVFKIRGNHDALSKITQELVLPEAVKVFAGRAETVTIRKGGLDVAIHGLSFAKPHAPESLLPKYRAPEAGAVNIGIMHTSLAGAPGHDAYAPVLASDLHAAGFDYWALGHIHQRADHAGARKVIMPGMPQGRDINEAGPKTVSLVTVHDDRSITIEERLTSSAQFERVGVDLTQAADWREAMGLIESAIGAVRQAAQSEHLVARLRLTGASELAWRLRRDMDLLQTEAEQRAEAMGKTWVEKIDLEVTAPLAMAQTGSADPLAELGALMHGRGLAAEAVREDVRKLVDDLRADLPVELRKIAGDDEAAFEAFVARLLDDGSDDILARLKTEPGAA